MGKPPTRFPIWYLDSVVHKFILAMESHLHRCEWEFPDKGEKTFAIATHFYIGKQWHGTIKWSRKKDPFVTCSQMIGSAILEKEKANALSTNN